jgi:hypothetical protein
MAFQDTYTRFSIAKSKFSAFATQVEASSKAIRLFRDNIYQNKVR